MNIERSDMEKIYDTLVDAAQFHIYRDEMNCKLNLSSQVRFSPLTTSIINQRNRLEEMLKKDTPCD